MASRTRSRAATASPLTLLDTLAHAPVAAALVVQALKRAKDRKALRLAHPQLRDAVGEATTKLLAKRSVPWRLLTPARWPRLKELTLSRPGLAALEALGAATWGGVCTLRLKYSSPYTDSRTALGPPYVRALAAALRRMPALRELELREVRLPDAAAEELFRVEAAPQLRSLTIQSVNLSPAAARMLAATGWRLEALDLTGNDELGAAAIAALLAAPTFALRFLALSRCRLDATSLLGVANAPWPLEELDLSGNDFSAASAAPALAALSRHRGLRGLSVGNCIFSTVSFNALVEAAWPALTSLIARGASVATAGPLALGAAAAAGFPVLEELVLPITVLDEAGARLLLSRRWPRLKKLDLIGARLGAAGVAALARGEWPALKVLRVDASLGPLTLRDARRWAPALVTLYVS